MVRNGVAGISQLSGVLFGVLIGAPAVFLYTHIHLAVTGQSLAVVGANGMVLSHWRGAWRRALNRSSLCPEEAGKRASDTLEAVALRYHLAIIGTPHRKHLSRFLLETILSVHAKEARPTTLSLAWDAHNGSKLPSYIKNLSPQVHVHSLEAEIPDPPSNRPGISNVYSALLIPEEVGMPTLPSLMIEGDIMLVDDFHLYLSKVVQLVESKMGGLAHRKYMVTLYTPIDWRRIGPLQQVLQVRQGLRINESSSANMSTVEGLSVNDCFPDNWDYGTQGVLVSAQVRSPLREFLKPYALGEQKTDLGIDLLFHEFLHKNNDSVLCFSTSPSLVEHMGVLSALFGENQRFHMSKDFPREVSLQTDEAGDV